MGMGPMIAGAVLKAYSGIKSSQAQEKDFNESAKQNETNAALARFQADDSRKRGEEEASLYGRHFQEAFGKKQSDIVGQGVDAGFGSASHVLNQANNLGALDLLTLRNNAANEAYGFEAQGRGYDRVASQYKEKAKAAKGAGIATLGLNFLNTADELSGKNEDEKTKDKKTKKA